MDNINDQLKRALEECERLKKENAQLKQLLASHNISFPPVTSSVNMDQQNKQKKIRERISIFRNLFKGRVDVFAIRWESKEGKTGYSPARKRKGEDKQLIPLTDEIIYDHLSGKRTIGIYPLLRDDTCWFLAVDFDKQNWKEDVQAFMETCKRMQVPASIERSRSGNGCHVWVFFEKAIPASLARKLGHFLLSKTLEKRYQVGVDSYDRMFPNQDKLPKGGFGNLIALPLQRNPRAEGNSVFVDESYIAYRDQWQYLSNIEKMDRSSVEKVAGQDKENISLVKENKETKNVPKSLQVIYKNGIYIPKEELPSSIIYQLVRLASFNNPAFFKAEASRRSTYNIPRVIDCTDACQDYLVLPRGCLGDFQKFARDHNMELITENRTNLGEKLDINFHGHLTVQQEEALQSLINHKSGIISAATGFGKTVVAAALIAKRSVNTLVIVHTKELVEQWKERIAAFLNLKVEDVGQIGGGKNKVTGEIDIATIQSLHHQGEVKKQVKDYGQIIVDECHHISAVRFEAVLKEIEPAYVHGLTATPTRKDGLQPIMKMQCGQIRYKVTAKEQAKIHPFKHLLIPRKTAFKSNSSGEPKIQKLYEELMEDERRNELIFNDVLKELEQGSAPIILTERVEHVKKFERMFEKVAKNIIVLTGGMKKKEREGKFSQLDSIADEKERLIIATGKYIGEGFDHAVLDTLFLAMPISWKGVLQQYAGRLHRVHDKKQVVKIYDYVDAREEMLRTMYEKRKKGYKSMGYTIEEEAKKGGENEQMKMF